MEFAEINIEINKNEVKNYLENLLHEQAKPRLILADLEELIRLTCMGKTFLESYILNDSRVKQYERRLGEHGKRYWIYEPVEKVILEIVDEW